MSRIIVSLGNNREIYEISKYRKDFVKAGDREVINVDIALEKAQRGEASFTSDESVEHARLTDAALTYWEDSSDINMRSYLQPVWVFQGEIPAGSAKNTRFEAIVPALKWLIKATFVKRKIDKSTQLVPYMLISCRNHVQYMKRLDFLFICAEHTSILGRMKIIFDDYDWKLIGISKEDSSKQEITVSPKIMDTLTIRIMEGLAKHHSVSSPELKVSKEYQNAKEELREKLRLTQQQNLITITALSRLTKIAEDKLLSFLADDEDFDTGELFALSVTLDQIQM